MKRASDESEAWAVANPTTGANIDRVFLVEWSFETSVDSLEDVSHMRHHVCGEREREGG